MLSLKHAVSAATVAVAVAVGASAQAQDYPDRAITIVVPFAAGTTTDLFARILGRGMENELGQPIVIENRPGAGGSVGTQQVVAAQPDGYTLSMGTVGTLAINKTIYPNLPYDPETDVTPISLVGYTPTLLVVAGDSQFESLSDLVEYARDEENDGVTFASAGNGTSGHLAGELLKTRSGGEMIHVPFGSGAEGLVAVSSGEVDFMFYHPVAAMPHIESGDLRALGVSAAEGSTVAPDVPPIDEAYPEFDLVAWFLLAGPAGMSDDVTQKLHDAAHASLETEEVRAVLADNGIEPGDAELAELPQFIADEVQKWGEIAEAAGAQVD